MSNTKQIDIDYVANLARIELTKEEKEAYSVNSMTFCRILKN